MHLTDEIIMQRCLELARNGLGHTAPNPMVGSVIVHEGRVIGEGFHTGCGKPHAEVEAVNQVKDHTLLSESTLYVNLEPCNHQGRTPPCTDLILEKGIKKVVIGQADPHETAGGGIERLRSHGVEVITGILEDECRHLNRRFNTFHQQKRPYIILKWAQTKDGYVDIHRTDPATQPPARITDDSCQRLVHKWRSEEQAILVGSNTIRMDNPQLTVRDWAGKNPVRVTVDRRCSCARTGDLRSPLAASYEAGERATAGPVHLGGADRRATAGRPYSYFTDGTTPTLVYTHVVTPAQPSLEFIRISPDEPVWPQVLTDLYARNIQSVLVEGGPTLLKTLIDSNLWDEARVFIGPGWLGSGIKAPDFPFRPVESEPVGQSDLLIFRRNS